MFRLHQHFCPSHWLKVKHTYHVAHNVQTEKRHFIVNVVRVFFFFISSSSSFSFVSFFMNKNKFYSQFSALIGRRSIDRFLFLMMTFDGLNELCFVFYSAARETARHVRQITINCFCQRMCTFFFVLGLTNINLHFILSREKSLWMPLCPLTLLLLLLFLLLNERRKST